MEPDGLRRGRSTVITETTGVNPSVYGDSLLFTATVSGPGSTPSGTIQWSVNGAAVGDPVTLIAGVATLNPGLLPVGAHTIDAAYSGDANFSLSNATRWSRRSPPRPARRSSPRRPG